MAMSHTRPLCTVNPCHIPARHLDDCERPDQCRGCLPGLAADGARICTHHTRRLGQDVLTLAARHRQLGLVLAGSGQPGERTTGGNRNPNITLNLRAAGVRRDIEATIRDLARMVCDQRGFAWPTDGPGRTYVPERPPGLIGPMPLLTDPPQPTDRIPPLARLVATSAGWLAAHERAGETCERLAELSRRAFSSAFPAGTRMFELPGLDGERFLACPEQVDDPEILGAQKACPGYLWAIVRRDGDRLPGQIACNHADEHMWPAQQWMKLGRRLIKDHANALVEAA